MAAIIDGTTYEGYWKLTPDNASPNAYYLVPKGEIFFNSFSGRISFISDPSAGNFILDVSASTIDGQGNALATDAAVSEYLKTWR